LFQFGLQSFFVGIRDLSPIFSEKPRLQSKQQVQSCLGMFLFCQPKGGYRAEAFQIRNHANAGINEPGSTAWAKVRQIADWLAQAVLDVREADISEFRLQSLEMRSRRRM